MTNPYPAVFETYESKRPQLSAWAQKHYVDAFGLEPCSMLEAGCGEGFWADVFANMGFDAHGFDLEPAYITAGKTKYPGVDLQVADALLDLPYEPSSFPLVFARAISCFYDYRLTTMKKMLANLLCYVSSDGLLLIEAYTDGSGEKRPGAYGGEFWHHPHDAYVKAAEATGRLTGVFSHGRYIQIGIAP